MEKEMITLLKKIAETAQRRPTLLCEYEESPEITDYALAKYGHWNGIYKGTDIHLGRLYHRLFDYRLLNRSNFPGDPRKPVPFHCYEIAPGDVLFTTEELQWDDSQQQYTGTLAEEYRKISHNLRGLPEPEPPASSSAASSKSGCAPLIALLVTLSTCALYIIM